MRALFGLAPQLFDSAPQVGELAFLLRVPQRVLVQQPALRVFDDFLPLLVQLTGEAELEVLLLPLHLPLAPPQRQLLRARLLEPH